MHELDRSIVTSIKFRFVLGHILREYSILVIFVLSIVGTYFAYFGTGSF